jgi:hypothetical protein
VSPAASVPAAFHYASRGELAAASHELFLQHPILLDQMADDLGLLPSHPAGTREARPRGRASLPSEFSN